MRKHQSLIISFIFVSILGICVLHTSGNILVTKNSVEHKILYVGGVEPGNYSTIQSAIDDANPGDTVFVYNESSPYYEHLIVNKTIILIGEDKNTTRIDGNGTSHIIKVFADGVTLKGFTIQNGDVGIGMYSNDNYIFCNIIMNNCDCGIRQNNYGSNNIIKNNKIIFNGFGIYIHDTEKKCNNNLFTENFIVHNKYAGFYDNDRLDGGVIATWNVIADNDVSAIGYEGVYKHDSDSIYHHNDFFFNHCNAIVDGGRHSSDWDDGSEGNYWDDWEINPGYPDVYIVPSDMSEEIDRYPSPIRWTNDIVVDGVIFNNFVLVNETVEFYCEYSGGVAPYSYYWDFGDGYTASTRYASHEYEKPGSYEVTIKITDFNSNSDKDIIGIVNVGTGPPYSPTIDGPTFVRAGAWKSYKFVTVDPDGDEICYKIEWGDGNIDWNNGPFGSGEEVYFSHSWSKPGSYKIKACARDGTLEYGPYGYFNITVLRNRPVSNPMFHWFLERFPMLERLLNLLR